MSPTVTVTRVTSTLDGGGLEKPALSDPERRRAFSACLLRNPAIVRPQPGSHPETNPVDL
jgi:hypothetical protein